MKLCLLLSAAMLAGCSKITTPSVSADSSASPGIVNGRLSASGEPMAMRTVFLRGVLHGGGQGTCTGSLIGDNLILTAGHCLPASLESGEAIFGLSVDPSTPKTVRKITAWIAHDNLAHPGGGFNFENDVGLIKFEGSLPEGYQTFALPVAVPELSPDTKLWQTGYGGTDESGTGVGTLREAVYFGRYFGSPLTVRNFSMSYNENGPCFGDSGGPLAMIIEGKLTVVGIDSTVDGTKHPSQYCHGTAGFVGVLSLTDWIKQNSTILKTR